MRRSDFKKILADKDDKCKANCFEIFGNQEHNVT